MFRVFAIDDDEGRNGEVVYEIRNDDDECSGCFLLDANTGWVTRGSNSISEDVSPKIDILIIYVAVESL